MSSRTRVTRPCSTNSACALMRGQPRLKLSPRAMDVLVHLSGRAGEVISAEELLASLSPQTVKLPNAVAKVMTELRRVLDEAEPGTRLQETVPKRGYRLVAPVVASEDPIAEHPAANATAPANAVADSDRAEVIPAETPVVRGRPGRWRLHTSGSPARPVARATRNQITGSS